MKPIIVLPLALALAGPAAADAHVTLQPSDAKPGFGRIDVRVPNERDDAATTKVEVQFPDGISSASYEPVPGWTVKVTKEQAPEPIEVHGVKVTEQVDTVVMTAESDEDGIGPGQFRDFGLSVNLPGKAGDELVFKAVQTYEGGEVVRWIGTEGSDEPAPVVTLAGESGHGSSASSGSKHSKDAEETDEGAASAPATGGSSASGGSGDGGDALLVGGIVGLAGIAAAVGAFQMGRRRPLATT